MPPMSGIGSYQKLGKENWEVWQNSISSNPSEEQWLRWTWMGSFYIKEHIHWGLQTLAQEPDVAHGEPLSGSQPTSGPLRSSDPVDPLKL